MGEVYVADDSRLGRQVAIKVIRGSRSLTAATRARFEQEARAASALNHPNIVTIHDIGEEAGQPFIVMELLEGQSLRELVRQPVAAGQFLRIAFQIADALSATHEREILHRDLKPDNIFVTRHGVTKILDFGVASIRHDASPKEPLTLEGSAVGTLGYMAPEVIAGGAADFRSDMFSFGCILYEMATGSRPFKGASGVEIIATTLSERPPPVVKTRPDLPPMISTLIETMLQKDPRDRHRSTDDVRKTLAALAGADSAALHVSRPTPKLPEADFPLLGRERELRAIHELIVEQGVRLVSLTGPGGSGKTRLAIAAMEQLLPWYGGRVFYVPLAAISNRDFVGAAIAQALGGFDRGREPISGVITELQASSARTLLVIDNFEQVIEAASILTEILAACPTVSILVTSREILHLYAERALSVSVLPVPEPGAALSVNEALANPAVMLFVQRARATASSFDLNDENLAAVIEVCRQLDGLPLAIELAAARTRLMTPHAMLKRLDKRLKLLTGGARDLPGRQQTLRGTLDWSHELLSADEQTIFRRLAVFAGSFTLEHAQAVADPFERLGVDVVDGIGSLVDKSLVVQVGDDQEEPRFTMLGIVRDYAAERLEASGDEYVTRKAHAAYLLVLTEEGGQALSQGDSVRWLSRFARENDNLRAALEWVTAAGMTEWGLRLAVGIFPFWERSEHLSEGRKRLNALLALPSSGGDDILRARALFAVSVLSGTQGDYKIAAERAEESLALYRRLGDPGGIAIGCNCLGLTYKDLGQLERASEYLEESLEIWKTIGDDASLARSLTNLAMVRRLQNDHDAAREMYQQTEALFRRLGDDTSTAWVMNHQGDVARETDRLDDAFSLYTAALSSFRELNDQWGTASTLVDLGGLFRRRGEPDKADTAYREALAEFSRLTHRRGIARVLEAMALLDADQGRYERALTLAGAASRLRDIIGSPLPEGEQAELSAGIERARKSLDQADSRRLYQCGQCMGVSEAIDYALREGDA